MQYSIDHNMKNEQYSELYNIVQTKISYNKHNIPVSLEIITNRDNNQ